MKRIGMLVAAMVLGAGCSGDSGDPTEPDPTPTTLDVTLTLRSIQIVQDCDDETITLLDDNESGEFVYKFWVSWPDGSASLLASTTRFPSIGGTDAAEYVRRGGTGSAWTFGAGGAGTSARRVFAGPGPVGITVRFAGMEVDKFVNGWGADEDMAQPRESQIGYDPVERDVTYSIRTGDVSGGNVTGSLSLGLVLARCHLKANFAVRTVEG